MKKLVRKIGHAEAELGIIGKLTPICVMLYKLPLTQPFSMTGMDRCKALCDLLRISCRIYMTQMRYRKFNHASSVHRSDLKDELYSYSL